MADTLEKALLFLREACEWPIPDCEFEDLVYAIPKDEVQFLRNEAFAVKGIYQLRRVADERLRFFIVDFADGALNRFAIRRIAIHFTTRPHTRVSRAFIPLDEMIFLAVSGGKVFCAHFVNPPALFAHMGVFAIGNNAELDRLLSWNSLAQGRFRLPEILYVRFKRVRSPHKCTEDFIEQVFPESLDLFRNAIAQPSITQSEEDELFDRMREGDQTAKSSIFLLNLHQAFDVSFRLYKPYEHLSPDFETILDGAMEGLLMAIDKYSPNLATRFKTYSWMWVSNRAERNLIDNHWPFGTPYYFWTSIAPLLKTYPLFEARSEVLRNAETVDEALVNYPKLLATARLVLRETSVILPIEEFESIPDSRVQRHFDVALEIITLMASFDRLDERERIILLLRLGLHPEAFGSQFTLEECARLLNLTRERIRQIEKRARLKLTRILSSKDPRERIESEDNRYSRRVAKKLRTLQRSPVSREIVSSGEIQVNETDNELAVEESVTQEPLQFRSAVFGETLDGKVRRFRI